MFGGSHATAGKVLERQRTNQLTEQQQHHQQRQQLANPHADVMFPFYPFSPASGLPYHVSNSFGGEQQQQLYHQLQEQQLHQLAAADQLLFPSSSSNLLFHSPFQNADVAAADSVYSSLLFYHQQQQQQFAAAELDLAAGVNGYPSIDLHQSSTLPNTIGAKFGDLYWHGTMGPTGCTQMSTTTGLVSAEELLSQQQQQLQYPTQIAAAAVGGGGYGFGDCCWTSSAPFLGDAFNSSGGGGASGGDIYLRIGATLEIGSSSVGVGSGNSISNTIPLDVGTTCWPAQGHLQGSAETSNNNVMMQPTANAPDGIDRTSMIGTHSSSDGGILLRGNLQSDQFQRQQQQSVGTSAELFGMMHNQHMNGGGNDGNGSKTFKIDIGSGNNNNPTDSMMSAMATDAAQPLLLQHQSQLKTDNFTTTEIGLSNGNGNGIVGDGGTAGFRSHLLNMRIHQQPQQQQQVPLEAETMAAHAEVTLRLPPPTMLSNGENVDGTIAVGMAKTAKSSATLDAVRAKNTARQVGNNARGNKRTSAARRTMPNGAGGIGTPAAAINNKNFMCTLCGRRYCRKSTLKVHSKQHAVGAEGSSGTAIRPNVAGGGGDDSNRPFNCMICGKHFSQAANLTAHRRVHTGEKPFSCPICHRPFSQSSSLVTHKRTHTGERPYPCPHCEKAFTDSSTLTKHLRTHTGQKPYSCALCLMKFSQSGNLHRHMKTHMNTANIFHRPQ